MRTKCEKCHEKITTKNMQKCVGLLCSKIYCNSCYAKEFSRCSICRCTMLCSMCVLVWDICPKCLDKDNAVLNNDINLYCVEQMPAEF